MAQLTPTLALTSSDTGSDAISLSVTPVGGPQTNTYITVESPSANITRVATDDNPLGLGAGILIADEVNTKTTFVYVKHLGLLASDGTTSCHATNDFVVLTNADGDHDMIKLQPGEFCFFPLFPADGSDDGVEPGGLKVEGGGVGAGGAAHVMIEYGYWTRT